MDKFIVKVLGTIDKYNMIKEGQTAVMGISGGYDSMSMLYALNEIHKIRHFDICAVHINHSFRDEADADCEYVKDVCDNLKIPFFGKKFDVERYANENKISFETAGREIRYSYFEEISKKFENPVIATAHNANDSIESFFMHLMRGSGLSGLRGILPVRGNVIRPVIECNREEIEAFCKRNNIEIRNDITNASDDYTRNDIRHNIVSEVIKRCSTDSLMRTMDVISADDAFIEEYVAPIRDKYILCKDNIIQIDLKRFNPLHKAVKRRIIKSVLPFNNMGMIHIDECIEMANNNRGGKVSLLPNGVKIEINKGILFIRKPVTDSKQQK